MIPDSRPIGSQQNDNGNLPSLQILLVTKILVCRDERIKAFRLSASKQVSIL